MKACKRSHLEYPETEKSCPQCARDSRLKWYAENRNSALEAMRKWKKDNPEKVRKHSKKWRLQNPEKVKEIGRKSIIKNPEKKKLREKKYRKKRYHNDVNFRLASILRNRLGKALKNNFKKGSAVRDLGCSIEKLKIYLESHFESGMTWENYGEWHIDHKIPLSSFDLTDPEQFKIANNYLNLTPMWAILNRQKFKTLPNKEEIAEILKEIREIAINL